MFKRVVVGGLFLVPVLVFAWTPAAEQRIAEKSAALAPPDLKLLLDKYSPQYKKGVMDAAADEGSEAHRFILMKRSGKLRNQIEQETATVIRMIQTRQPLSGAMERLGRLVHYVSDANNPFHVSDQFPELSPKQRDFESYFERKLEKFPTVFYGLEWPFTPSRYVGSIFERSASLYPLVHEEYFRHGETHSSEQFDDRSTAFGVASVAYSHAVTDLVNLYYYIWKEAGGDVRTAAPMRSGNLLLGGSLVNTPPPRTEPSGNRR